jgi:DNA-binding XRE family transcriptional regulator
MVIIDLVGVFNHTLIAAGRKHKSTWLWNLTIRARNHRMAITPAQCRAARGLLGWNQDDLAKAAKVGVNTLRNFEADRSAPMTNNLAAIQSALEAAGIEFIPENGGGAGLRLRKGQH